MGPFRTAASLLLSLLPLGSALPVHAQSPRQVINRAREGDGPTIEMSNVLFRYTDQITVLVSGLRGRLEPTAGHQVADFNNPDSFVIAVQGAQMSMTTSQLASLMNNYLLSSPKAQIKDVQLAVEGDHILMKGTMKKGLHIPFQATAVASITQDNRVRFDIQQMKSLKIPIKGFMDLIGLDMGDLVSQKGLKGLSVDKDSLLIDPQTAFPSPQLRGKLTRVQVAGQGITLSFGEGATRSASAPHVHNVIAVRGGTLRYGREQMSNVDITLLDTTPADPFDFFLRQYTRQFAAGTIKPTQDMALRAYLPDFAKLNRNSAPR